MKTTLEPATPDLAKEISDLGPWFHNLHLPNGTQTAPDHFLGDFPTYKWETLLSHIPRKIQGWDALDIGCNAGFYSIELAKRGANVLAIDIDPRYLKQAKWAARQFGIQDRIEFREMPVYQLARLDRKFDLVLFMGVFYHLRYPILAIDIVSDRVSNLLVFQTLTMPGNEIYENTQDVNLFEREVLHEPGWPKMAFVERCFSGDPTNWWIPNHACVEALLRSCALKVIARPGHEIYICKKTKKQSRLHPYQKEPACADAAVSARKKS